MLVDVLDDGFYFALELVAVQFTLVKFQDFVRVGEEVMRFRRGSIVVPHPKGNFGDLNWDLKLFYKLYPSMLYANMWSLEAYSHPYMLRHGRHRGHHTRKRSA